MAYNKDYYEKNKKYILRNVRQRNKTYILRNQKFIDEIKLKSGCIDCGYNKNPIALDFDHIKNKRAGLSQLARRCVSLETIKKEIDKCEIVCAICHRIRTQNRRMAKMVTAADSKSV